MGEEPQLGPGWGAPGFHEFRRRQERAFCERHIPLRVAEILKSFDLPVPVQFLDTRIDSLGLDELDQEVIFAMMFEDMGELSTEACGQMTVRDWIDFYSDAGVGGECGSAAARYDPDNRRRSAAIITARE